MQRYAPDVYAFLEKRWRNGLDGQPYLPEQWEWNLPETWAGHLSVPRFFREEEEVVEGELWTWDNLDGEQKEDSFATTAGRLGSFPSEEELLGRRAGLENNVLIQENEGYFFSSEGNPPTANVEVSSFYWTRNHADDSWL